MNLMDLFVKISVDDQASSQVETLSGKLKSGLATAAKVGASAVAVSYQHLTLPPIYTV